ncbi:restriction endonuclease [Soehngenia longivitae]|uniref:Restriction endonuclease n=1 Tax=Soehngenia longivitae TaxID=2562294 RepID=A0A4Z0D3N3_9FIRM|nr:restriction endonuclease [Soehngenia longivitae]TFZ40197.1 restriction endonuclease [Soehngenia longivitae]
MELGLENDLIIRCDRCSSIHIIDKDSLDVDTYSYERNMGFEVEYVFAGEYSCEKCGNFMHYTVRAYEYPVGILNYEDYESRGCTFAQAPSIAVNYYEFDYRNYEEVEIGTEVNRAYLNIYKVLHDREEIYNLSSREFEEFVAELFRQQGFDVALTPETRDGGCDIIATKNIGGLPFMLLIECKKHAKRNPVGVSLVRSLLGVQADRKANKAVLVTTSSFTKPARQFAERQQHLISLVDINDLMQMIR